VGLWRGVAHPVVGRADRPLSFVSKQILVSSSAERDEDHDDHSNHRPRA
jgi:hypothetical protein